jgi:hypothetical protein
MRGTPRECICRLIEDVACRWQCTPRFALGASASPRLQLHCKTTLELPRQGDAGYRPWHRLRHAVKSLGGVFRLGKAMKHVSLRNWMLAAAAMSTIVAVLIASADVASAQSSGRGGANVRANVGGYCPNEMCGKGGGRWARNLANCFAANCKK